MPKLRAIAFWTIPSLVCVLLYREGLTAWFQMDDFAWLALGERVHDFRSFLSATFTPYAQGSIRPLSERLFFMGLYSLFGVDALPFRAIVFATQCFNLVLLAMLMLRVTGSRLAAFAAPLLWTVNANIYWPMVWTSAYNQILCSTVLLGALYLFVRWTETARRGFYAAQWAVFLLGFGVLELNVVYPAIAFAYAMVRARPYVRSTLPMFAVSLIYAAVHRAVRPPLSSDLYRLYFDSDLVGTLGTYVRWVLGAEELARKYPLPVAPFTVCTAVAGLALALAAAVRLRRGDGLPLFCLAWFFLLLGPLLPLKTHISEYYLTAPSVGLAMLGGYGLAAARSHSRGAFAAALGAAAAYAAPSAWAAHVMTERAASPSHRAQALVEQLAYVHRRHPGKAVVLRGVDSELFLTAIYDRPFRIFGLEQVYLTADSEPNIHVDSGFGPIAPFFLPETAAYEGIRNGRVVVYQLIGTRLRNVTDLQRQMLSEKERAMPRFIDAGEPMYAPHLREGWHRAEDGYRWMGKRAAVEMAAPEEPGETLEISGTCPSEHMARGPLRLSVTADGQALGVSEIGAANLDFTFRYALPAALVGRRRMTLAIELDRTVRVAGDDREFGVTFGRFLLLRPPR